MWRMTWQALSVRPRQARVYNVEDDVAGDICQALPPLDVDVEQQARRLALQLGTDG